MNRFHHFAYVVLAPIKHLFFRLQITGLEHLPRHGALLCPNHCSNWDPVLLCLALPADYRIRIMAKDSLFRLPVLGWIVKKLGAFPVARGSRDIQAVRTSIQTIKDGDNLLIFPEGTRVEKEGDIRPKSGAAVIGIRAGAVFVPVYIEEKKKLFHQTRIIFGEPYTPKVTGRHGTAEEMQVIADSVIHRAYCLGSGEPCKM